MTHTSLVISTVRCPVWSGHQAIHGLWLPVAHFSPQHAQMLAITHWQSGSQLYQFDDGLVLRWPDPQHLSCATLTGWPLVMIGSTLSSAPLQPAERRDAPSADLWLIIGGTIQARLFAQAQIVQSADWIDLSGYTWHEMYIDPPPAQTMLTPKPSSASIRRLFGQAALSPEQQQLRTQLHAPSNRTPRAASSWQLKIMQWVGQLIQPWVNSPQSASSLTPTGRGLPERQGQPTPPSRFQQWLHRFVQASQLSRLFEAQQAAYLQKMLNLFDDNNLQEALKHAIPLSQPDAPAALQASPSTWNPLSPRQHLNLSSSAGQATQHIGLQQDIHEHLRKLYRKSFEQLDRQGNIDDAVFILAELLDAKNEAISYLEKHQRYQQAADLALLWDLHSGLLVRLFCLAKQPHTAVLIARRDNAFSEAVLALEKTHPSLAQSLRVEWAQSMRDRGDWLKAVDILWPYRADHPEISMWIESLLHSDHLYIAVRALIQHLILKPDHFSPDTLAKFWQRSAVQDRHTLHTVLLELYDSSQQMSRTIMQQIIRQLLPYITTDQALKQQYYGTSAIKRLISLSQDDLLSIHVPTQLSMAPAPPDSPSPPRSTQTTLHAPFAGLYAIFDAVPVDQQHYLIAHGELGLSVVTAQGKIKRRLMIPAQHIVSSRQGQVFLLLAKRDEYFRVTRLDLITRQQQDLGLIRLQQWSNTFDGIAWSVISQQRILVLDTCQSVQHVLWHISDEGELSQLCENEHHQSFVVHQKMYGKTWTEIWHYSLPTRKLLTRQQPKVAEQDQYWIQPDGSHFTIPDQDHSSSQHVLLYSFNKTHYTIAKPAACDQPFTLHTDVLIDWIILTLTTPTQHFILVHMIGNQNVQIQIQWPQTDGLRYHLYLQQLMVFDQQGRCLCVDLKTQRTQDIRLH